MAGACLLSAIFWLWGFENYSIVFWFLIRVCVQFEARSPLSTMYNHCPACFHRSLVSVSIAHPSHYVHFCSGHRWALDRAGVRCYDMLSTLRRLRLPFLAAALAERYFQSPSWSLKMRRAEKGRACDDKLNLLVLFAWGSLNLFWNWTFEVYVVLFWIPKLFFLNILLHGRQAPKAQSRALVRSSASWMDAARWRLAWSTRFAVWLYQNLGANTHNKTL